VGRLFLCADVSTRAYLQQRQSVSVKTVMPNKKRNVANLE